MFTIDSFAEYCKTSKRSASKIAFALAVSAAILCIPSQSANAESVCPDGINVGQVRTMATAPAPLGKEEYEKGLTLYNKKNYNDAFRYFKVSADLGYQKSMTTLGTCYMTGSGVKQDKAEGAKWYQKAADQGYAPAQNLLGHCYALGTGVKKNQKTANSWYLKAANLGDSDGQYNLGLSYYLGSGLEVDYSQAFKYFTSSAKQDNMRAQYCLGICYFMGQGTAQNDAEAAKWMQKSAAAGDQRAQVMMGCFYAKGVGVDQDSAKAKSSLKDTIKTKEESVMENMLKGGGLNFDIRYIMNPKRILTDIIL